MLILCKNKEVIEITSVTEMVKEIKETYKLFLLPSYREYFQYHLSSITSTIMSFPNLIISRLNTIENNDFLNNIMPVMLRVDNLDNLADSLAAYTNNYYLIHNIHVYQNSPFIFYVTLYELPDKCFCVALDTAIRKQILTNVINSI